MLSDGLVLRTGVLHRFFQQFDVFERFGQCCVVGTAAEGADGVEVVGAVDVDAVVVVAFGIGEGIVHAVFCGGTGFQAGKTGLFQCGFQVGVVFFGGFDGLAGIDDGEGDVGVFVVLLKDGAGFRAFGQGVAAELVLEIAGYGDADGVVATGQGLRYGGGRRGRSVGRSGGSGVGGRDCRGLLRCGGLLFAGGYGKGGCGQQGGKFDVHDGFSKCVVLTGGQYSKIRPPLPFQTAYTGCGPAVVACGAYRMRLSVGKAV